MTLLLALTFAVSLHPSFAQEQTSSQVRIQKDWQSAKASQVSGNRPVYPALAAATQIEGGVILDFVIAADGTTKDVSVLAGHPLLVQSAIDAVRSWRFKPTAPGDPEVETITTVNFFLPGHDSSTYLAPYRKNVGKHPDDAKEHEALGRQLLNIGEADAAAAEFRTAISLQPNDAGAHFSLGNAMGAKGDVEAAIAEYRNGLSMNPNATDPHYDLARWFERKGDLDNAVAEYRIGLKQKPKEGNRHYSFGLLLMKKQDAESAVSEYREALRNGFDTPFVHYELGRALEQRGDLDAAAQEIQRALKDMPQNQAFRDAYDRISNRPH
jgi:TonB family protein